METQHFYERVVEERTWVNNYSVIINSNPHVMSKKGGMHQYIYWHDVDKMLEANEIVKYDGLKYIMNNIKVLEKWSGKKYSTILYDSKRDGDSKPVFKDRIMNQSQLYFIVIDSSENVFGHYHPGIISDFVNYDRNIFMFLLKSNGRYEPVKYTMKFTKSLFESLNTRLFGPAKSYYECCHENFLGNFSCYEVSPSRGSTDITTDSIFSEMHIDEITGRPFGFIPKRIFVFQMK